MNALWVRILFVVSLVLNVFLIGAAVGVVTLGVHLARDRGAPPPGAGGQLWRASQAPTCSCSYQSAWMSLARVPRGA